MHIPKNYFRDRAVLLILATNGLLALLASIIILFRLDGGAGDYIVQYRANMGLNAFTTGAASSFVFFVLLAIFVAVFHTILSIRIYNLRRHFSVAVLGMGTLLLVLIIIVSNALLMLR